MNATIDLGERRIGPGHPTFIIAEAGVNHNGRLETALELVDVAVAARADAVKFQTFKTEELVSRELEKAPYQARNTGAGSQWEMIKSLELDEAAHWSLRRACDERGIRFMSTPFYEDGVDMLMKLQVCAIKVDSGNLTNVRLLRYIAGKGLPVILSTGMSSLGEVEEAVEILRPSTPLCLLHCTSNYPARIEGVHLHAMQTLRNAFELPVGYSDHTPGIGVSVAAVALGACVIEKHFTIDRESEGPDHKASLMPDELSTLVREIRRAEVALGHTAKHVQAEELSTVRALRRSIVAARDIERGTTLSEEMLVIKRPGDGIQPRFLDIIVGRVAQRSLKADQLLTWDDV